LFIDINGVKTHYIEAGTGDPLLILHGWGCDAAVYSQITKQLSKHYRVILPELPGFGKTAEPLEAHGSWDVSCYAEFVLEFCKALNFEPSVVFAHSLGCRIAIKLLSQGEHSKHSKHSNHGSSKFEPQKVIFTGAAGIKPKQTASQKLKARIFKVKKLFLKPFPALLEKMRQKYGSADYRNASPMMRRCLVKIVNEDLTGLLPNIKQEVLLIWGENDDSTPLADGRLMEKLIPDCGLAVIKNAGHYAFLPQMGQPELFWEILKSYLKLEDEK